MSDTPPVPGQEPWGEDLNDYLASLNARLTVVEARKEHVFNSYPWKFSSAAPPAGSGELRLNDANPVVATVLNSSKIDGDGADRTPVFQQVKIDDMIRVQDWDNAAVLHRFRVTGAVTYTSTNAQVPVVWMSGNGSLPTTGAAKISVGFLLTLDII